MGVLCLSGFTSAQQLEFTDVNPLSPPPATEPSTWEVWGLKEDEWRKYEAYMRGEGKYHYQHLDPVFVMGMITDTEQDKDRYAQLYVQQEFSRTTRLIDFDERYRKQFNSMFGPLKPHKGKGDEHVSLISQSDALEQRSKRSFKPVEYGDRITVFVGADCKTCANHFHGLLNRFLTVQGVSIDLFFVGQNISDNMIREWAKANGIRPSDVQAGKVTLNHDDRYQSFGNPGIPSSYHVRQETILGKI